MLTELSTFLQTLLRERGKLDSLEVEVRFEPPTRQWVDSLTQPTISFFLFNIRENTDIRETNLQSSRANGKATLRMPPRRMDLCYMVSALTSNVQDEHMLLWWVNAILMKYQQFPAELLPEVLRGLDPAMSGGLNTKESGVDLLDLWDSLGTPPHPCLYYVVTVPLDLETVIEAPLVLSRKITYRDNDQGDLIASRDYTDRVIRGVLRNRYNRPIRNAKVKQVGDTAEASLTDASGRFELHNISPGSILVAITLPDTPEQQVTLNVPSDSYDILIK